MPKMNIIVRYIQIQKRIIRCGIKFYTSNSIFKNIEEYESFFNK